MTRRGGEPRVSIVIPVFNQWELTARCLEALPAASARVPHEILVIDNASSDATPRQLAQWKSPLRVIRNETNRGFAPACNQGAAAAQAGNVVFLNNDTQPVAGWLEALVDEVARHDDVWAVGARLLYGDGSIQHAGVAFARETRNPYHPYRALRADDPRVGKRRELQAVTAACVLLPRQRFEQCGRFDEGYRNGYEDLDLCLTLRARGGKVVYQPGSVVVHLESKTPGRLRSDAENRARFFERWSRALLSDEDAFYFEDGLRIARVPGERAWTRLVRFDSEQDRARWALVARLEQDAALGRHDDVRRALARTEDWPDDADVRAFAGALCLRFALAEPARHHLAAASVLGAGADVRVLLARSGGAPAPGAERFEAGLAAGLGHLRAARWSSARRTLELALAEGAPAALVLPGLWEAARESGDAREAEALEAALRALPRVDPATERRLQARIRA